MLTQFLEMNIYTFKKIYRPIFKKPILGLRIESKLRIAGVPTEHLFSLDAYGSRENKCSAGIPAILSLDPILRPMVGFMNMGHSVFDGYLINNNNK